MQGQRTTAPQVWSGMRPVGRGVCPRLTDRWRWGEGDGAVGAVKFQQKGRVSSHRCVDDLR